MKKINGSSINRITHKIYAGENNGRARDASVEEGTLAGVILALDHASRNSLRVSMEDQKLESLSRKVNPAIIQMSSLKSSMRQTRPICMVISVLKLKDSMKAENSIF